MNWETHTRSQVSVPTDWVPGSSASHSSAGKFPRTSDITRPRPSSKTPNCTHHSVQEYVERVSRGSLFISNLATTYQQITLWQIFIHQVCWKHMISDASILSTPAGGQSAKISLGRRTPSDQGPLLTTASQEAFNGPFSSIRILATFW